MGQHQTIYSVAYKSAAARAVVGYKFFRWSYIRILNNLGWLNVKQQYVASTLTLTHKIVTTRKPENLYRSIVTHYPYPTRRAAELELRTWSGTVRGRDRTALTLRAFKYQSIAYYNSNPMEYRGLNMEQFKKATKKWTRSNVV